MAGSYGPIAAGLLSTLALFGLLAYLANPHMAGPAIVAVIFAANLGIFAGALLHILTRADLDRRARLVWVAMSLFVVPVFSGGAIVYLLLGKERTRRVMMGTAPEAPVHIPRISTPKR